MNNKIHKIKKNYGVLILLAVLILFHLGNNIYFLAKYPLAEGKDSYAHVTTFLNFSQIIKNGEANPFYIHEKSWAYNIIFSVLDYPPFFYFCAFCLDLMFGKYFPNPALFTGTLFLSCLLIGLYNIGTRINRKSGVIAAFLCSMYPLIFFSSRHFGLELVLAAMVCFGVWLLLKTDFFMNRLFVIMFGLVCGLGMLTKQTFILYIIGPIFVTIFFSFKDSEKRNVQARVLNIGICFFIALLVSASFYYNKLVYIHAFNRTRFLGAVMQNNMMSWEHILYYPKSFLGALGIVFCSIFVWGLFSVKKIDKYLRFLLLSWILGPFFIFSFILLKYSEYSIAYLPAVAIISTVGLKNINQNIFRKALICIIIAVGVNNFYALSFEKIKMFHSTYYSPNQKVIKIEKTQDEFMPDSKTLDFNKLIKKIGNSSCSVGIFYDDIGLIFPKFFLRNIFAYSKKQAEIVDISFRATAFFDFIDKFDYMIFITKTDDEWINEKSLGKFFESYNSRHFTKMHIYKDESRVYSENSNTSEINRMMIPEANVDRLIEERNDLTLVAAVLFSAGEKEEFAEKVYIYRRQM